MASQFSDQQRRAIINAFNELDTDKDGKLSKEVDEMLRSK